MDGVFGSHDWDVEFAIYDGAIDTEEALLYRYGERRLTGVTGAEGALVHRAVLRQAGLPWLIVVSPRKPFSRRPIGTNPG